MWHHEAVVIRIKRIYESPEASDGYRVLIDRLWPRGLAKADAAVDLWLKDIAPTTKLRTWFAHDPDKWVTFQALYRQELARNPEPVALLRECVSNGPVTLLYAARDQAHNHAPVLQEYLLRGS